MLVGEIIKQQNTKYHCYADDTKIYVKNGMIFKLQVMPVLKI